LNCTEGGIEMGGGKGGGTTTVSMPSESKALYNELLPVLRKTSQAALGNLPLYNLPANYPTAPTAPDLSKYIGDIPTQYAMGWHTPNLKVAEYNAVVPTKDWWSNLTPSIKQGIMQPFEEGSERLREQLNKVGQLGSARGGVSGVGATGMSNYWADAMPKASLTGWQQYAPGMMAKSQADFMAQNEANRAMWQDLVGTNRAVWQLGVQNRQQVGMGNYQAEMNRLLQKYAGEQQLWNAQAQALAAPYSALSPIANAAGQLPMYASYEPSTWSKIAGGLTTAASLGLAGMGMYGIGAKYGLWGSRGAGAGALGGGYPFGGGVGVLGSAYDL
jgi:hypothetical protein